jgi:hypothetical protein
MVESQKKTLRPREIIALLVVNEKYDTKEFEKITFAEKEVARILPLF